MVPVAAAVEPAAAVAMPLRKKRRRWLKRRRWKPLLLICLVEMMAEITKHEEKGKAEMCITLQVGADLKPVLSHRSTCSFLHVFANKMPFSVPPVHLLRMITCE